MLFQAIRSGLIKTYGKSNASSVRYFREKKVAVNFRMQRLNELRMKNTLEAAFENMAGNSHECFVISNFIFKGLFELTMR